MSICIRYNTLTTLELGNAHSMNKEPRDFNATVNTSAIVPLKKQIGQVITEIDDTKIKKNNIKRSKELNSSEMSVELKMIDHQQGQLEQTLATLKATLCEVEHLEKSQED